MRKSLITTAVLGALIAPSFVFAADAAPAPDLTVAYNVGLYSQYIFRGLTQTNRKPALQGGVDLTHSSGLYAGAWASNVDWTVDSGSYKSESLELDLYGGYRYNFGDTGIGIDVGALQYIYPGTRNNATNTTIKLPQADTTEVYAALNYGWVQAKISDVVSSHAWGVGKNLGAGESASGTYYAELNATIPLSDLAGAKDGYASGITGIAHIARQEFSGDKANANQGYKNSDASYTDYKLGLQKAFTNGVNVGAFWSKANTLSKSAGNAVWQYASTGANIGDSTGTIYVQKTF